MYHSRSSAVGQLRAVALRRLRSLPGDANLGELLLSGVATSLAGDAIPLTDVIHERAQSGTAAISDTVAETPERTNCWREIGLWRANSSTQTSIDSDCRKCRRWRLPPEPSKSCGDPFDASNEPRRRGSWSPSSRGLRRGQGPDRGGARTVRAAARHCGAEWRPPVPSGLIRFDACEQTQSKEETPDVHLVALCTGISGQLTCIGLHHP
jgi:hypothetical protein